ncbi:hypothetical protein GRI62_00585 [Erythrobacter arachoides]|uniref:Uncharacterized protein n=1 Tax=Aurantiacibacter arachoides TaxID=1850444 RepID=A0A844ZUV2_9SPHN|nr:hypothetical protein [Aurantiacibacter arachoides]MXO92101.1 hypothetical protein [Aurantiacibacter arachoides]GGD59702.1 hypothetical protein GCM10011411_19890 [Aurantiacibacter arachoides]
MLFALTTLLAALAPQDLAIQDFDPFMTFSRSPTQVGEPEVVDVGILRGEGRLQFWFRRTVPRPTADGAADGIAEAANVTWTDTRRCPGARDAVVAATQIEPPGIHVPGIPVRPDGSVILSLDGVRYAIRASSHYDSYVGSDIVFESNVGTPLANWVEGSLGVLANCWADEEPLHNLPAEVAVDQPSPE